VVENRAAVLAAAKRVFLARGYAGASLDAIAEEAGFSKGVVYSQFGGKADLFLALLDSRIDERAAENERIAGDSGGAASVLALLENFERDSQAEAGWRSLLVEFRAAALRDPELNRRYAASHERTIERLADLLAQVHARVDVEPAVAPRTMAEFILAVGAGLALERAANPDALGWPDVARMMASALGFEDKVTEVVR